MFLDEIAIKKREDVERARAKEPLRELRARALDAPPVRGFLRSLKGHAKPRVICEIKRASPSRGAINAGADVTRRVRAYEAAGAAAVSVLTDSHYFGGSLADLVAARQTCKLPLLRKDFTVDAYQIFEARAAGADAVLLIVAMLETGLLKRLRDTAVEAGLDALVEVHDERELEVAIDLEADFVGVNNRDLKTLQVSLDASRRLLPCVPSRALAVAESGIRTPAQVRELWRLGARAFLVGEALMEQGEEKLPETLSALTEALLP
ncbi:MAG: indole-3-glycerol phosphate synthase TrpC [Candidatus Wallbacteria bacterium]|nr:indole-3-glycerol phosphate synthase TrpC [Candidatus Wallbacteria bacterium]